MKYITVPFLFIMIIVCNQQADNAQGKLAMLLGSVFLLIKGSGKCSVDTKLMNK